MPNPIPESISRTELQASFLSLPNVWDKLAHVSRDLSDALEGRLQQVPAQPARDAVLVTPDQMPVKKGFASVEGQARMLHDLASIELQALELGLRTLIEFPDAPAGFREELARVTQSEAEHFRLCLEALEDLGHPWGSWPVHVSLWNAVAPEDSLLDRILIVHRYLEGSGLDAGETLLRRLHSAPRTAAHPVVAQIVREEIGHVEFGSRWFREVCIIEKIDAQRDFEMRFEAIKDRVPRRIEKISRELRLKAGFSEDEIAYLERHRERMSKFAPRRRETETSGLSVFDLLAVAEMSSS